MNILLTGGAGYIGSHACVVLLEAGHDVVVVDNFSNSSPVALERVEKITGKSVVQYPVDLTDRQALRSVFEAHPVDAVMHFAGLKAVDESVSRPLHYYWNNVTGSVVLLQTMAEYDVRNIVFSSSATVYGATDRVPTDESCPPSPTNPYGRSKWMVETILSDLFTSDPRWHIGILRYFNPVGAHESGLIGEDPNGIPNNLVPYIAQVAVGKREWLRVWGNDYPTPDGTGIRDFIHVMDLVEGHLSALETLLEKPGCLVYNLGTGKGTSVLEMVAAFESASERSVPYRILDRRPGDIAVSTADPGRANRELGWHARRDVFDMCRDTWRWQRQNPDGYGRS
uniref:UDP-glucose 4-epimerase n=1 Tax=Desulfatirhabdium butyrativorans TaxID=340467 RepID=A0A7C4VQH9_9BACT